jgi:flagellar motor protein MotB
MHPLVRIAALAGCLALSAHAEDARPFSQTLTAEQKARLGLSSLSAAQLGELDAAVSAYGRGETAVAVQQATQQVEQRTEERVQQAEKKAAETAVADYKKKQEPGVIARTLEVFKHKQEEDKVERFTAHVVGEFRGWQGGTYFPLENGQVWRQSGTESVEMPPEPNAEVEIYRSKNGYWRLRYHGAWITVKRLQ